MVEIFKALSQENRTAILALLSDQPLCVCDIESNLQLTQSNASRHLSALRNAGIIKSYKTAQWVYFTIDETFQIENESLWQYLCEQFEKQPYLTIRQSYQAVSSCSGPFPVELKKHFLRRTYE